MARLKQALVSSPTLRKIDYQCERPVIVTVDTSPIAIGWKVGQDDDEGCRFATRFGARVLSPRQRDYLQVKRELWGVVTALKMERNYLIGAHVVLEMHCLLLLGMIANFLTLDIAMLRWIAYIKTLNPELRHIVGKDNPVVDMLSRARYTDEDNMVVKDDDQGSWVLSVGVTSSKKEGEGIWATYMKIKRRYWWKSLYQDAAGFVESCVECQMQSKVRHRDGLKPTYPLSMHFQWVLDLVIMPIGIWGMRYLVLAREELSNYVEGRALRTKATKGLCRFILEDIFYRYGSVGRLRADRGELDTIEARQFFDRYGIKLKLTTSYNPEGNGKSERGHPPIIQALVKACKGKPKRWPQLLPFALWADRTTHSTVIGYMPTELMLGQKPIVPMEDEIPTWTAIPWEDVVTVHENATYSLRELDGTPLKLPIAGKRVKYFRRCTTNGDFTWEASPYSSQQDDTQPLDEEESWEEEEDEDG
ncbi:hypothetical protein R1flu_025785 [Riccia fluitans]|uniref:Integrase catalytic domain-containing protein n=1 Tax=Riccia fluitans TaxID=41844 RepID=A0ABD1XYR0_9MARC